ncbi:MAG: DUF3995 domain-containing protein [Myxococcota bacterium]
MSLALWLAAMIGIFSFWLHTVVGHLTVHQPLQSLGGTPIARGTTAVCWHLTTAMLGFQAVFLTYAAVAGRPSPLLLWVLVALNGTAAALFVAVSRGSHGGFFALPQWTLLAPIALLIAWHQLTPILVHAAWTMGVTLALIVFALAILHIAWGLGSPWPERDQMRLLALVVGTQRGRFPSPRACFTVAGALTLAGVSVLFAPSVPILTYAPWAVGGVFLLRGVGGYLEGFARPECLTLPYGFWNRTLYSPLCLGLGTLALGFAVA